jgi:endonuclease G
MRRSNNWPLILLVLAIAAVVLYLKYWPPGPPAPQGPSEEQVDESYSHLRWGNPSGATSDPGNRDNYLMKKQYYALSYNNTKGTPNWVSWHLSKEDLGNASRAGLPFLPDEELPAGFKKVVTREYAGSGFDRGHMCPAADRGSDMDALKATFVMTNLVPQSPANNRKGWEKFESYCRSLVKQNDNKELYIVSGPNGEGGTGENGFKRGLPNDDNPRIVVPASTWKVVMVMDRGEGVNGDTRLIAVNTPNDETVTEQWWKYQTSVRSVEQMTGYRFFAAAGAAIESLKDTVDTAHGRGR